MWRKNSRALRKTPAMPALSICAIKIRLELIPLLRDYNPNIRESLIATADICRADDQVLEDLAENALAEIWINDSKRPFEPGICRAAGGAAAAGDPQGLYLDHGRDARAEFRSG